MNIEKFKQMLKAHDWLYEYSDSFNDVRKYREGAESHEAILYAIKADEAEGNGKRFKDLYDISNPLLIPKNLSKIVLEEPIEDSLLDTEDYYKTWDSVKKPFKFKVGDLVSYLHSDSDYYTATVINVYSLGGKEVIDTDDNTGILASNAALTPTLEEVDDLHFRVLEGPTDDSLEELKAYVRDAKKEIIENPSHYTQGGIQPLDFIVSNNMSFLEGNVVKYVTRYKFKNGLEDLKKAQVYLNRLINKVENE